MRGAAVSAKTGSPVDTPIDLVSIYDLRDRERISAIWLHAATVIALAIAYFGVPAMSCVMLPAFAFGIPRAWWMRRDRLELKRRRALREAAEARLKALREAEAKKLLDEPTNPRTPPHRAVTKGPP